MKSRNDELCCRDGRETVFSVTRFVISERVKHKITDIATILSSCERRAGAKYRGFALTCICFKKYYKMRPLSLIPYNCPGIRDVPYSYPLCWPISLILNRFNADILKTGNPYLRNTCWRTFRRWSSNICWPTGCAISGIIFSVRHAGTVINVFPSGSV